MPRALIRSLVDQNTASSSKITLAAMTPKMPPAVCTSTYNPAIRLSRSPSTRAHSVTAGLKCAPDVEPNSKIRHVSAPAVAIEFSSSCSPTSFGLNRSAMIPEPTTLSSRNPVPTNSDTSRLAVVWGASVTGTASQLRANERQRRGELLRPRRHDAPLNCGAPAGLPTMAAPTVADAVIAAPLNIQGDQIEGDAVWLALEEVPDFVDDQRVNFLGLSSSEAAQHSEMPRPS